MWNFLVPVFVLALIARFIHSLLKSGWASQYQARAERVAAQNLSPGEAHWLVRAYGSNTNSFLLLYPGFQYFTVQGIDGTIAYIETPQGWVAGAEPLASRTDWIKLLKAFHDQAEREGKKALLLPVSEDFATEARQAGFTVQVIGAEPKFLLDHYPPSGSSWLTPAPTAKILQNKGAKVREFRPSEISEEELTLYNQIAERWLGTRKMSALGFLNQVHPWRLSEHKKYFVVELEGKALAFVAAVPILTRKAWYLIDVLREPGSPAGTTELLILEAMRMLGEQGATEITLGVAPLAGIKGTKLFDRTLRFFFNRANIFYNFKPLFDFKMKFSPTRVDSVYLIAHKITWRELKAFADAYMPSGFFVTMLSGFDRALRRWRPSEWIRKQVDPSVVVRSIPPNWYRLLLRCKLTASLILVNLVLYLFTTDQYGNILPGLEEHWGFSWNSFVHSPVHALILSPFLHWNLPHIGFNLLTLVFFTGGLEYLAGTPITAAAYFIPMLTSDPLLSFILVHTLRWFNPGELDVGASLGIFGCAGTLLLFMRRKFLLFGLTAFFSAAAAIVSNGFLPLSHCTAALIGLLVGWIGLR